MAGRSARTTVALVALLATGSAGSAFGAEIRLELEGTRDGRARPLVDAVASLHPAPGARSATGAAPAGTTAEIDQRNANFVPEVIAIQRGTQVRFPNSDNTLHHVYSFSPAKRFELPLYSGKRAEPVLFDKSGVVILGCNIHDWMVAHVIVLDTPWHARSGADGRVRIDAPPGDYVLQVWHANAAEPYAQRITLGAAGAQRDVRIALSPPPPATQDQSGPARLRALQQRLRTQPPRSTPTRSPPGR